MTACLAALSSPPGFGVRVTGTRFGPCGLDDPMGTPFGRAAPTPARSHWANRLGYRTYPRI